MQRDSGWTPRVRVQSKNHFVNAQTFVDKVKGSRNISMVDAVIGYNCPYSGETHILVLNNAFCVLSMPIT